MVKTGSEIFTVLSLVALAVPLLPVFLIIKCRVQLQPVIRILMALCLLVFAQQLSLYIPFIPATYDPLVQTIFHISDFALIYCLFSRAFLHRPTVNILNMTLVSLLSVFITIYSLKGIHAYAKQIAIIQAAIPAALVLAVLLLLIRNRQIVLFREMLFWIAGGTLCYSGMYLFMEFIIGGKYEPSQAMQQEKEQLLLVIHIIRFVFFSVAVRVAPGRHKVQDSRNKASI